jgi:hypothetical protein
MKETVDRIKLIDNLTEEMNAIPSSEGNRSHSLDHFQDPLELSDQIRVVR